MPPWVVLFIGIFFFLMAMVSGDCFLDFSFLSFMLWYGNEKMNFPGSSMVKNPSADAEDIGLIPDPERSHVPWSN